MSDLVNKLVSRFDSVAQKIFQAPIESLSFEERAVVSAALAVIDKHMKDRRKRISDLLQEQIEFGDTEGWETEPTESGKSVRVDMPHVKLMRTESGGGRSPDVEKMRALLESKDIDPSKVVKPTGYRVNMDAIEEAIEEFDLDRDALLTPKGWEVDESILGALIELGHLTLEEVENTSTEIPKRVSLRCTFEKDTQQMLLDQMKAMEGEGGSDDD